MTTDRALRIVERACGRKTPMSLSAARAVARDLTRRAGVPVRPYRCPFRHRQSWHVGHAPSWAAIEELADVLRLVAAGELELERQDVSAVA